MVLRQSKSDVIIISGVAGSNLASMNLSQQVNLQVNVPLSDLICGVCNEMYNFNDSTRKPMILCRNRHTVCNSCFSRLVMCPTCRETKLEQSLTPGWDMPAEPGAMARPHPTAASPCRAPSTSAEERRPQNFLEQQQLSPEPGMRISPHPAPVSPTRMFIAPNSSLAVREVRDIPKSEFDATQASLIREHIDSSKSGNWPFSYPRRTDPNCSLQ